LLAGNPIPCLDPAVIVAQPGIPAPSQDGQGALIYVLFTSGSTGRPKGVAMRSEAIAALVAWHQAHARLGLPARTLQFAPLGFDVAFQEILTSFATGGTLVLASEAERRDPYALLDLIEREHIERVYMPYVALQALAEAVAAAGKAPSTLRDVITAGEQLRITPAIRALFGALHGSVLHNHYGPTEAHVVTAHELVGDPGAWPELPPIGRPLPHVRIRLVDEAEQVVEGAAEGELLLGGTCLAAGYIQQPELTRERFIERDGARWYRTGDRVRDAGDGELHYLGRVDAQIKLDGYRIEPAEIEAVLCRHPAVAEAAVVASGDSAGRRLIAHVVPRDAQAADDAIIAELRAHCHAQLAPYLVPQIFVLVPLLPLTASGKVDRQTLADAHADTAPVWPQSLPLPQQLAALWRQLLGLAEIDPQANLFDLGARSLTVVRALTELRRHGYRKLTAAQIYEHPSVAKLAACLAASTAAPAADAGARLRGERQRAALHRFAPHPRGTS
jgi:amino acid adenylation domain-containing protein